MNCFPRYRNEEIVMTEQILPRAKKPIISKLSQPPNASGRAVKRLFEAKIIFSFFSLTSSFGSAVNWLSDKSRISKLSANDKISTGKQVKFSDIFKRVIPASSPDFN